MSNLLATLNPLMERIQQIAIQEPEVRKSLHAFGQALVAFTESIQPLPTEVFPSLETASTLTEILEGLEHTPRSLNQLSESEHDEQNEQLFEASELTASMQEPSWKNWPSASLYEVDDDDLPEIEEHFRLKAEASRWAKYCQERLRAGADWKTELDVHYKKLINRARDSCYLWMMPTYSNRFIAEDAVLEDIAGCFDAASEIVALIRKLRENNGNDDNIGLDQALFLAAEAQSAIRQGVKALGAKADNDQVKLFNWLRSTGEEEQIYIPRFMRLDDYAELSSWNHLLQRVRQLAENVESDKKRRRRQKKLFSKIRYNIRLIKEKPGQENRAQWKKIFEVVSLLVEEGLPPSNRKLREYLWPTIKLIPETLQPSGNFQLVQREIHRYVDSRPIIVEGEEEDDSESFAPEVQQVAELLGGKALLLIGGDKRQKTANTIEEAFNLQELIWLETREHQSYTICEPHIARAEVEIVVLAIRWASHGLGEIKSYCDKYGKHFVRLPAGYSPNQMAFRILEQVGERLAA